MSGKLICVVGASGVGKDSLLAGLRSALTPDDRIVIAHRYITRAADAGGENHIALSEAEFQLRRNAGCFALHWQSHGLLYGIGREIELWLASGLSVVLNGSRGHLPSLRECYPQALVVEITASEWVLRERLQSRGREDAAALDARLARHRELPPSDADLRIANEGPLADTVDHLLGWVRHTADM
ncbi:phosphonate metabolism protein/1,5-bisphosphokinase (PRPP-forming) PhnN [Viridibacterium curvum]|uniref:Ribose 1,5-bisphosphate phosphokinase PhnN n=1 Tax=Viridibacterium curvum TaxID=1101404 RepID=A0ABP9Q8L8_9RHOO